jgi:hypothetical protein
MTSISPTTRSTCSTLGAPRAEAVTHAVLIRDQLDTLDEEEASR